MAEGGSESLKTEDDFSETESSSTSSSLSPLSEAFEKATVHLQSVVEELDSEKLLYFYARYKQANDGPCNVSKPGFFDFQGKQKWTVWKDLGEMSKEKAMQQYIDEMKSVDPKWNPEEDGRENNFHRRQFGVAVSTMARTDEVLNHADKNVFDFVKDNLLNDLKKATRYMKFDFDQKDGEGLALLHWACDRGNKDIVQYLLDMNANVNIQDTNKQTPLHYASSCGHSTVISILLTANADATISDDEDMLPKDVALNKDIEKLFN